MKRVGQFGEESNRGRRLHETIRSFETYYSEYLRLCYARPLFFEEENYLRQQYEFANPTTTTFSSLFTQGILEYAKRGPAFRYCKHIKDNSRPSEHAYLYGRHSSYPDPVRVLRDHFKEIRFPEEHHPFLSQCNLNAWLFREHSRDGYYRQDYNINEASIRWYIRSNSKAEERCVVMKPFTWWPLAIDGSQSSVYSRYYSVVNHIDFFQRYREYLEKRLEMSSDRPIIEALLSLQDRFQPISIIMESGKLFTNHELETTPASAQKLFMHMSETELEHMRKLKKWESIARLDAFSSQKEKRLKRRQQMMEEEEEEEEDEEEDDAAAFSKEIHAAMQAVDDEERAQNSNDLTCLDIFHPFGAPHQLVFSYHMLYDLTFMVVNGQFWKDTSGFYSECEPMRALKRFLDKALPIPCKKRSLVSNFLTFFNYFTCPPPSFSNSFSTKKSPT